MADLGQLALVAVDGLLYSALLAGVLLRRSTPVPVVDDVPAAFGLLEKALKQSTAMRPGFTWGEAIARARSLGLDVDWAKVAKSLDSYEVYRYGGGERPRGDNREVVRLAMLLKRRGKVGT